MWRLFGGQRLLLWIELIRCLACINLVQGRVQPCKSVECAILSQNFYGHLNIKAEPCEDFYEYACGNWIKQHPIPDFADQWSTRSLMHLKTMMDLRILLESKERWTDDREVIQAKKIHKACINIPQIEKDNFATIKGYVQKLDSLVFFDNYLHTPFSWWMVDNYYLKISGESAFFDVSVMADAEGEKEPILHISMLTSPFGNIIRRGPWSDAETDSYIKFLMRIMLKLLEHKKPKPSRATVMSAMLDVLNIRTEIQKIMAKTTEQRSQCARRTIGEFQKIYDEEAKLEGSSDIDFLEHARVLLGDNWGEKITMSMPIYVCDEYYFRELSKLLHTQSKRNILNHIHLYFVERHLIPDTKLKQLLKNSFSGGVNPSGLLRGDPERWYTCIKNNNMKSALDRMYITHYFTSSVTKSVNAEVGRIVDEMKIAIESQINKAKWMVRSMRMETINKVHQTEIIFGYPGWYFNHKSKVRLDWPVDPLEVNAYNILRRNVIVINPAILQPPMFSSGLIYAAGYGMFGFTLGHELYHGLTSNGLHYNSQGTKQVWWPIALLNMYETKEKCFIEEYSKYRVIELEKELGVIYNNGARTVAENIADTMGLKAAYLAFKKKLETMEGECPKLPHFTRSSCEQLFFISFANTFCMAMRPFALLKHVQENHHSTSRTRVNGAVSNMPEFSKAFNCKPNSFLNPKKKCDVWE